MIHHIDRALEQFLRDVVPARAGTVDISFHAPDQTWTSGLTRPTIDLFLWEVGRHQASVRAGVEEETGPAGNRRWRPPTPVVALRYAASVWTREQRDEHELLGALLAAVLGYDRLPETVLPEALRSLRCGLSLGDDQHRFPLHLWPGTTTKAAVALEVTLPVEAFAWLERAAPVEAIAAQVRASEPEPADARGRRSATRGRSAGAASSDDASSDGASSDDASSDDASSTGSTGSGRAGSGGGGREPGAGEDAGAGQGAADGGGDPGQETATPEPSEPRVLRRRGQSGALVMEGRRHRPSAS